MPPRAARALLLPMAPQANAMGAVLRSLGTGLAQDHVDRSLRDRSNGAFAGELHSRRREARCIRILGVLIAATLSCSLDTR